ncbi:MAG: lysophospholipid acyltransferase family protein [Chlorobium sp.]
MALRLLYASLRISITPAPLQLSDKGAIIAFWHGKMIAGWLLAKTLSSQKNITAVVSLSEDGRALADTLERLGFSLIRGSSSKGGDEVKQTMQDALQKGDIVVLTPDGPRGPINQFKYGTLRLASNNHYPIVFAEISYAKRWRLKSWDQFEIPKPFSKTSVKLHLLELPEFKSDKELQLYTKNISARLSHA